MELTLIRSKRTKQQNQERAYIAAARRTDRSFKQRLDSLQKASELHFARTGKRFKVDEGQLSSRGPLEEIEKGRHSPFYQTRFTPYPQPCDLFRQESSNTMFKTETETDCSSTKVKHPATGLDSFQPSFLSYQLKSLTYEESKSMGIRESIEQELWPPINEKDAQNLGIHASQVNRIHTDKPALKAPRIEALHSYSAFPPGFFKHHQFERIQHRLPNMNEPVQNFIDEYFLQLSPTLLTLSISEKLVQKVPLFTSAKEHVHDDAHFTETVSDLFQDIGDGDLRDEKEKFMNSMDWNFDYLFNGNDENLTSPLSQVTLPENGPPNT